MISIFYSSSFRNQGPLLSALRFLDRRVSGSPGHVMHLSPSPAPHPVKTLPAKTERSQQFPPTRRHATVSRGGDAYRKPDWSSRRGKKNESKESEKKLRRNMQKRPENLLWSTMEIRRKPVDAAKVVAGFEYWNWMRFTSRRVSFCLTYAHCSSALVFQPVFSRSTSLRTIVEEKRNRPVMVPPFTLAT